MPCGAVVWAQEEVRVCSVPRSARNNVVGAVIVSGMVEMAETVVGTSASCMLMVLVG